MKPKIKAESITFKNEGFHGGRLNVNGDGYVIVEFELDKDNKEISIIVSDKLNTKDGHYAPLDLSLDNAEVLNNWLSDKINKLRKGDV